MALPYALTASPGEIAGICLNALFTENYVLDRDTWLEDMIQACEDLSVLYLGLAHPTFRPEQLVIDYIALRRMVLRFRRDVFGVALLHRSLDASGLPAPAADGLKEEIAGLSIRINSPSPLQTRRAAAFTLWMTTFRPFSLRCETGKAAVQMEEAVKFCSGLTFWISTSHLKRFGEIRLGSLETKKKRLARVHHDFLHRDLSLSSLEFFYSAIFSPNTPGKQPEITVPGDAA